MDDKHYIDPITFLESVFTAQVHNGLTVVLIREKLADDKNPEDLLKHIHMFLRPLSHGPYCTLREYQILAASSTDDQAVIVVKVQHASSGVVHMHALRCRGVLPCCGDEVIITNQGDDQ